MSDAAPPAHDRAAKPQTQRFRRTAVRVMITPEQRRRQASVMRAALDTMVSGDAIKAFLNDDHHELGGRPLDVAMASDAGLAAVEARIRSDRSRA